MLPQTVEYPGVISKMMGGSKCSRRDIALGSVTPPPLKLWGTFLVNMCCGQKVFRFFFFSCPSTVARTEPVSKLAHRVDDPLQGEARRGEFFQNSEGQYQKEGNIKCLTQPITINKKATSSMGKGENGVMKNLRSITRQEFMAISHNMSLKTNWAHCPRGGDPLPTRCST